jgi:hypothetical protein
VRAESGACDRGRSDGRDGFLKLSHTLLEKSAGAKIWLTAVYALPRSRRSWLISLLSPFFSCYSTNIKRFA